MTVNILKDKKYLDNEGAPLNLKIYEILQLDKSFLDNYKEEDFKKHVEKLYAAFYPGALLFPSIAADDLKDLSVQRQTTWMLILASVLLIKNPDTRVLSNSSIHDLNIDIEQHFYSLEIEEWLEAIELQPSNFDFFPKVQLVIDKIKNNQVLLNKCPKEDKDNETERYCDLVDQGYKLREEIFSLCKTGNDSYLLYKLFLTLNCPERSKNLTLSNMTAPLFYAASKENTFAMLILARMALSGAFDACDDKETSITWALNFISYIERKVIPELENSNLHDEHKNRELRIFKQQLLSLRKQIDYHYSCIASSTPSIQGEYAQGKSIPTSTEEFNRLVNAIEPSIRKIPGYLAWQDYFLLKGGITQSFLKLAKSSIVPDNLEILLPKPKTSGSANHLTPTNVSNSSLKDSIALQPTNTLNPILKDSATSNSDDLVTSNTSNPKAHNTTQSLEISDINLPNELPTNNSDTTKHEAVSDTNKVQVLEVSGINLPNELPTNNGDKTKYEAVSDINKIQVFKESLLNVFKSYHKDRAADKREYFHFYSFFTGYSRTEKLGAAQAAMDILEQGKGTLAPVQFKICYQGRLGTHLKEWEKANGTTLSKVLEQSTSKLDLA